MSRLFLLLMTITVSTLAGIGVIAVLIMGYYTYKAIIVSAVIGVFMAFPVSWLIARKMTETGMFGADD